MAAVADPHEAAAGWILGLDQTPPGDNDGDERVRVVLERFYSLAQLTPAAPVPEEVAGRVGSRLEQDAASAGEPDEQTPEDLPAPGASPKPGKIAWTRKVFSRQVRVPVTAVVLAAIALVLSIAANVMLSRAPVFRPEAAVYLVGTGSSPHARGTVMHDGDNIVVHAEGLDELASGYRYVAWHTTDDGARVLGSLTMLGGGKARLVAHYGEMPSVVVVTIEPSRSPAAPAGPQILVGLLDP